MELKYRVKHTDVKEQDKPQMQRITDHDLEPVQKYCCATMLNFMQDKYANGKGMIKFSKTVGRLCLSKGEGTFTMEFCPFCGEKITMRKIAEDVEIVLKGKGENGGDKVVPSNISDGHKHKVQGADSHDHGAHDHHH